MYLFSKCVFFVRLEHCWHIGTLETLHFSPLELFQSAEFVDWGLNKKEKTQRFVCVFVFV